MLNENEFVESIIQKVGSIIDTSGMSRTLLIFEILQMLTTLKDTLVKKEEDHKKEKEELLQRLYAAEAFMRMEENQNGREPE